MAISMMPLICVASVGDNSAHLGCRICIALSHRLKIQILHHHLILYNFSHLSLTVVLIAGERTIFVLTKVDLAESRKIQRNLVRHSFDFLVLCLSQH